MSSFNIYVWLEATRPKTLPASLVPVLLASSMAFVNGCFYWLPAAICFAFAVLIQIGTNFANDYLDGIKGTDTEKRLGPRRAVATGLVKPATMKQVTILVLALGFCVGLGLIPFGGWWLLIIGIASVACAWLYTGGPYPLAYNGLGDIFVILFFGFIAVGCSYYVQAGKVSRDVLLLGLSCGMLVNNLLVVNNYRDLEEDRLAQKRTLVVFFGRRFAYLQYQLSVILAGAIVVSFWAIGYDPYVLLALAPIVYGLILGQQLKLAENAVDFLKLLKGSAQVVFTYGALFSAGLVLHVLI